MSGRVTDERGTNGRRRAVGAILALALLVRVGTGIWRGETLIAAPVAGLSGGWTAEATGRGKFADFLLRR